MNSPLGKYAPLVASAVCIMIIGAFVVSILFGATLNIGATDKVTLQQFATYAFIFIGGTALGVNGWKREVQAIHQRLDEQGTPPAGLITPTDAS